MVGDFNEILTHNEKQGGRFRLEWQLNIFRETLDAYDLRDLGFKGCPFTWNNQREGRDLISKRIDRFMANDSWIDLFSDSYVHHVVVAYIDHVPIMLNTIGEYLPSFRGPNLFKFEVMWVGAQKCSNIVEDCWRSASEITTTEGVMNKIKTWRSIT